MASTDAQVRGRVQRLVPPEVGEGRVGLALPAPVGVPLRLPVADEEDAGHGAANLSEPASAVGSVRSPRRYARARC